jgi:hypothetical protein
MLDAPHFSLRSDAMTMKDELTERQRYWLEHLKACEQSGQSSRDYAGTHGLSVSMLYTTRSAFVRQGLLPSRSTSNPPPRFDRVRVTGSEPASLEWCITLPNGVVLGFRGAVDATSLATVLGVASRI